MGKIGTGISKLATVAKAPGIKLSTSSGFPSDIGLCAYRAGVQGYLCGRTREPTTGSAGFLQPRATTSWVHRCTLG
jgi:hypothetical protein